MYTRMHASVLPTSFVQLVHFRPNGQCLFQQATINSSHTAASATDQKSDWQCMIDLDHEDLNTIEPLWNDVKHSTHNSARLRARPALDRGLAPAVERKLKNRLSSTYTYTVLVGKMVLAKPLMIIRSFGKFARLCTMKVSRRR